jgi:hypothetical protein
MSPHLLPLPEPPLEPSPKAPLGNFGPPAFRKALVAAALGFFALMVMDEWRSGLAYRFVPGPLLFFSQIAGLFPEAKDLDVDFRVEGWSCEEGLYRELDISPFFPIQSGNKESRFERAMFFYHHNAKVMSGLDAYLTAHQNARAKNFSGAAPMEPGRIGGVRFVSASTPIPTPEEGVKRYRSRPLSDYPFDRLKTWYETPSRIVWERCR